jgi:anaphase-promoting complex subunit 2
MVVERSLEAIETKIQLIKQSDTSGFLALLQSAFSVISQHETFLEHVSQRFHALQRFNLLHYYSKHLKALTREELIKCPVFSQHLEHVLRLFLSNEIDFQPNTFAQILSSLGIQELVIELYEEIAFKELASSIQRFCADSICLSVLPQAQDMLIQSIFPLGEKLHASSAHGFKDRKETIEHRVMEEIVRCRSEQLFDIIVYYPDSEESVLELKRLLGYTKSHRLVAEQLKQSFALRLLHPGALTEDIISQFVSSMKVLFILDPVGVHKMFDIAAAELTQYLKSRPDTLSCIVDSLSNPDSGLSLSMLVSEESFTSSTEISPFEWLPECRVSTDSFLHLLEIFTSQQQFIQHYQSALGRRLICTLGYDSNQEIMNLEFLKTKFVDQSAALNSCDILIRDVEESRRIDASLQGNLLSALPIRFQCKVLSKQFWSNYCESFAFVYPSIIQSCQKLYSTSFESVKNQKQLNWVSGCGRVSLELEMEDNETFEMECSHFQASFILHLAEVEAADEDSLANLFHVEVEDIRSVAEFWIREGFIASGKVHGKKGFVCNKIRTLVENSGLRTLIEENFSIESSSQVQTPTQLAVLKTRVLSLLPSFNSLSARQIHSLLTMLSSASKGTDSEFVYGFQESQLQDFLMTLVSENVLTIRDSVKFARKV